MQDASPHFQSRAPSVPGRTHGSLPLAVLSVGLFLALTFGTLMALLQRTGGRLIYTLDDPYIHLALAERLALGHYGINLAEVTSPSSSVLWPFLFVAGSGTMVHAWLPLLLNIAFGAATVAVCGRVAARLPLTITGGQASLVRLAFAVLLVLATNSVGLVFTGLEHNLQVLLAVIAALGVIEVLEGRQLPSWAIAAAALGPAVRYEMLAITAALAIILLAGQRWRLTVALVIASLVLPVALGVFLVANGNLPLPNSVMSKLGLPASADAASWTSMLLPRDWQQDLPQKLVMWSILGTLVAATTRETGRRRWVIAAVALAAALHFLLGRFGWFYRYELYAVTFCGLVGLWVACASYHRYAVAGAGFAALIYAAAVLPAVIQTPQAAQNIYEQQYQMHRFVAGFYTKPFAVNDLGWVSYRLDPDIYVVDLWGLASNEAMRQRRKTPEWLDAITRQHSAGLAMIYRHAFRAIPPSWTLVAELSLAGPRVTAAASKVHVYATGAGDVAGLVRALRRFKPTLPAGVTLDIREAG